MFNPQGPWNKQSPKEKFEVGWRELKSLAAQSTKVIASDTKTLAMTLTVFTLGLVALIRGILIILF